MSEKKVNVPPLFWWARCRDLYIMGNQSHCGGAKRDDRKDLLRTVFNVVYNVFNVVYGVFKKLEKPGLLFVSMKIEHYLVS